jgi:hypothetical protein
MYVMAAYPSPVDRYRSNMGSGIWFIYFLLSKHARSFFF